MTFSHPVLSPSHYSLATEINTATHDAHLALNRAIIARLPLALPPHSSTPLPYEIGLSAFSTLYLALEDGLLDLRDGLDRHCEVLGHARDSQVDSDSDVNLELVKGIAGLLAPPISRHAALTIDLAHLRSLRPQIPSLDNGWCAHAALDAQRLIQDLVQSFLAELTNTRLKRQRRNFSSSHGRDGGAQNRAQIHRLLAWVYVLYMALFSGGRWIRRQLRDGAGESFWRGRYAVGGALFPSSDEKPLAEVGKKGKEKKGREGKNIGFSFLHFHNTTNEETQLKARLKALLEHIATSLSTAEREDVIQESLRVFAICGELVEEVDAKVCDVLQACVGDADTKEGARHEEQKGGKAAATGDATSRRSGRRNEASGDLKGVFYSGLLVAFGLLAQVFLLVAS